MKPKKNTVKISEKKLTLSALNKPSQSVEEYEKDFFKWTKSQARLLKNQEFSKLDIVNLIEEIESLGRSEKRALQSYLEVLLMHMLKKKYQKKADTRSWDLSIKSSNHKVQQVLSDNPTLKSKLKDIVTDAYYSARLSAAAETGLDEKKFPEECPWSLKELFPYLEPKYLKD